MSQSWRLDTHGKPLETLHHFFAVIWGELGIKRLLLPLKDSDTLSWTTEAIDSPLGISRSNPFTPLMVENIANKIPEFISEYPDQTLAALLKPCEIRALEKIAEKKSLDIKNLVIISADCLGTYPQDEFSWRAERKGSQDTLTEDTFHFSRLGGISPYRYRSACQLCKNPIANQAEININIMGIPIRQHLIISTSNGRTRKINLTSITDGIASQEDLELHKNTSSKVIHRNLQTQQRLSVALVENTNLNIESLVNQMNDCGHCHSCMDVCPICNTYQIHRDQNGKLSREDVANWMISCVGCGMCEQACPQNKPLAVLFSIISEQLDQINSIR